MNHELKLDIFDGTRLGDSRRKSPCAINHSDDAKGGKGSVHKSGFHCNCECHKVASS